MFNRIILNPIEAIAFRKRGKFTDKVKVEAMSALQRTGQAVRVEGHKGEELATLSASGQWAHTASVYSAKHQAKTRKRNCGCSS